MKVSELIERLEGFEPDMLVVIEGHHSLDDIYEIGEVKTFSDAQRLKETLGGEHFAVVVIG